MSIEVRNIVPSDESNNVSVYTDIVFDLVALDGYTIDITTLSITIQTTSNIDDDTHTITYTDSDNEVFYTGISTKSYQVRVNPSIPFEEGLTITIQIDVDGTDESSAAYTMDQYEISFSTTYKSILSDFRYAFIESTQNIPVYNEILKKNSTTEPTIFDSAFNMWNRYPSPRIQVNQVIVDIADSTYSHLLDYEQGKIIFDTALDYNDIVDATYKFSFFTDEQIQSFFRQAAAIWTISPPSGGPSDIYSATDTMKVIYMIGASIFAYREVLFSLAFQEKRLVFDNASWEQGWTQIKDLIKGLYDSQNEIWKMLLEAKKVSLPLISTIVSPEFVLPGGRTVFADNKCNIGDNEYVNFDTMYNIMLDKKSVDIKTIKNNEIKFCRVSCIEYEGKKDVFGVGISSGKGNNLKSNYIYTSEDHKYKTTNGMKRLKNIKKGEEIIICRDNKPEIGVLEEKGYFGNLDCYEIQVPDNEKFLCNDILVSNSRMFRYMYKGGV